MKMEAQCIPCLLNRIVYECNLAKKSKKRCAEIVRECAMLAAKEFEYGRCSADVATKVHRRAYKLLGVKDPYAEVKKKSNEVALSLLPKVEKLVRESSDPLKAAVLCAIIGNMMDFGIIGSAHSGPEHLIHEFDKMYSEGLGADDVEKIKKYLKPGAKIVLATDNCGEIVFDRLLAQELKKFGVFLTLVVRGGVIMTDATRKDALALGFGKIGDEILDTNHKNGVAAVGISFAELKPEVGKRLREADLILAKGMGNYEAFTQSGYRPVAYLMRTKCKVVAESIGLLCNINVAKLVE